MIFTSITIPFLSITLSAKQTLLVVPPSSNPTTFLISFFYFFDPINLYIAPTKRILGIMK